ncbi:ROK family protein [Psychrobacillus antarcticus]|uniref:ROK family protein n=1 Tax=Psychrobacillus antarcticus TaxID=2879115 RepID=UPI002407BE64|nr:ROK family protein [Psychrobacillus antarcticus]
MKRNNDRKKNLAILIDLLKREGPMTQTMIKNYTNFQASTISYLINDLRKIGMVKNFGETVQGVGPGKPGSLLHLNNDIAQFIGIYVEDNQINLYVLGLNGETIDFTQSVIQSPTEVENILINMVKNKIENHSNIKGIGIAMKAMVLRGDKIRFGLREGIMEPWELEGLEKRLKTQFKSIPLLIENDSHCTAILYQYLQKKDKMDLLLYMLNKVPFGIGCSILINGKLHKGTNGASGQYYYKGSNFTNLIHESTNNNLVNLVRVLMPHISTSSYLIDPQKVVLTGSYFNNVSLNQLKEVKKIIEEYNMPYEFEFTQGNIELDPGKGAAFIAINNYIEDIISKVGAR